MQWEARLIRDLFYADQPAGLRRFLPVVLPRCSHADIPVWLSPVSAAYYQVGEFTVAGAEGLLRMLTGQPGVLEPPLGPVPMLPPRGTAPPAGGGLAGRPGLRTEVVIEARLLADGVVESAVWVAGSLACRQRRPLPAEVLEVWGALGLPGLVAGERLAVAGRALAGVLLDEAGQEAGWPGCWMGWRRGIPREVVLCAGGQALSLPVELIRLGTAAGGEIGPLGLMPAGAVSAGRGRRGATWERRRRLPGGAAAGGGAVEGAGGGGGAGGDQDGEPAAGCRGGDGRGAGRGGPDQAAGAAAQVRILEVASLPAIRQALAQDAYHVLHLSAHGSPEAVELEDEDGNPVR